MDEERKATLRAFGSITAGYMLATNTRPKSISVHFLIAALSEPGQPVLNDLDVIGYYDPDRAKVLKPLFDLLGSRVLGEPIRLPSDPRDPLVQLIMDVWGVQVSGFSTSLISSDAISSLSSRTP